MIVEEVEEKVNESKEIEQRPNKLIIGLCIVAIIAIVTMMVLVATGVVGPGFKGIK